MVLIETDRLILRPPIADDLDGFSNLMGDEQSSRFIGGIKSRPEAWRSIATIAGSWAIHGFGMFSVIEKQSRQWIGRLGPWRPEGWPGSEVGWALIKSAWQEGYATEGAVAAIDWAFDHLGWNDVIHCIDPENVASVRLARRLGSTLRGKAELPPPFNNVVDIWGQSREQWRSRRRSPNIA